MKQNIDGLDLYIMYSFYALCAKCHITDFNFKRTDMKLTRYVTWTMSWAMG